MLKQIYWASLLSLAVTTLPAVSNALSVEQVPNPRQTNGGWVADTAELLRPETEIQINQLISQLEAQNGTEIAVVTVPQTTPEFTPKQFATSLFNYWGIGKKGEDNGVLFLISKGDRRVEIETGNGARKILPDKRVSEIIQLEITPRFKQSDFDGGTLAGTQILVAELRADQRSPLARVVSFLLELGMFVALIVTGSWVIITVMVGRQSNGSEDSDSSSSSSTDSSSSSSNFGGGSSDGGGAGGDW